MTKKTKVLFLGSRPLGAFALKMLQSMENVEVVACVTREPSEVAWWKEDPYHFAGDVSRTYKNHEELIGLDFDLGVSINYWKIIPPELITPPRLGFINLHHAFNLSLRGRNMTPHAILNARKTNKWFHGSCIHYIDEGLDTGPIIASKACEITELDTGWTLFNKVEHLGELLLEEWLPRLNVAKVPAAFPEKGHPINKLIRKEDDQKFIKNINADPLMTYDLVRAYDFNGHYKGMSTTSNGKVIELTIDQERGSRVLLEIDKQKKVYEVKS